MDMLGIIEESHWGNGLMLKFEKEMRLKWSIVKEERTIYCHTFSETRKTFGVNESKYKKSYSHL